jgi:phosphatidylinositol alpha-1,6-mannosyltransferase
MQKRIASVYKRATLVTAISNFTRDLILAKLPEVKIKVINPGFDPVPIDHVDQNLVLTDSIGRKHIINDLPPYIVSVGALRHRKGYHLSIRAFAKIAEKFPGVRYVIVGKKYGPRYYERMQYHIHRLRLEDKVIIFDAIEKQEELSLLYEKAELFALFSIADGYDIEGFGIVFLEAAAHGLPIVATKTGGISDAVSENTNALLVDISDLAPFNDQKKDDDFSRAIEKILRDSALRERMSEASRIFAKDALWSTRIQSYIESYKNLS